MLQASVCTDWVGAGRTAVSAPVPLKSPAALSRTPRLNAAPRRKFNLSINTCLTIGVVALLIATIPLHRLHVENLAQAVIVDQDLDQDGFRSLDRIGSNYFMHSLSGNSKRELAAKAHFISEIIKSHRGVLNPQEIAWQIVSESKKANYDPLFVASLVMAESSFKPHARSPKGAVGLMQIKPSTGRYVSMVEQVYWHGESQLVNPTYNLKLGIAYLKYLDKMFRGNKHNTLVAYNWGPGNLKGALRDKSQSIPSSSIKYSNKIQSRYAAWQRNFRDKLAKYQHMDLNLARG